MIVFLVFLVLVFADDDDEDEDEDETIIERERCDLFFLEAAAIVVAKVAPETNTEEERAASVALLGVVVNIVAKEAVLVLYAFLYQCTRVMYFGVYVLCDRREVDFSFATRLRIIIIINSIINNSISSRDGD